VYKSKTTFVIGAGASLELGFPTSTELKKSIGDALNISFELGNRVVSGDRAIAAALRDYADYNEGKGTEEYNLNLKAGRHVRSAMPQAISIDNFVDNQEDERVTRMAKLGIASCLMEAEKSCLKEYTIGDKHEKEINWEKFQNTWIHNFFQTLTEGVKRSELKNIFSKIKFIIFNYDRSLEFFLTRAIENYYKIERIEAEQIMKSASFMHPYGMIGALEWQDNELPKRSFGKENKSDLYEISQSILTFSEQIDDEKSLNEIRSAIEQADRLIFLGFAFHDSNMNLLTPDRSKDTHNVVGTAFGISDSDCEIIKHQLKDICMKADDSKLAKSGNYIIDTSATASSLFEKYRKTITS